MTQQTLSWSMLGIFAAVILVISISICLMCGDSKDNLEKRREGRKKRKTRNQSDSPPRSPNKKKENIGNINNTDKGSAYFGELDKASDIAVPLLRDSMEGSFTKSPRDSDRPRLS